MAMEGRLVTISGKLLGEDLVHRHNQSFVLDGFLSWPQLDSPTGLWPSTEDSHSLHPATETDGKPTKTGGEGGDTTDNCVVAPTTG